MVRESCQHCQDEKLFLNENDVEYRENQIIEEKELYADITAEFKVFGAPLTLAGDTIFQGYSNQEFGAIILETQKVSSKQYTWEEALQNPEQIKIYGQMESVCETGEDCVIPQNPSFVVPFFGSIEIRTESTALRYGSSFLLGFLDGFNPCAMWVLVMFIITLIQVGDRMKMIFVAGTFLIAETIMYGLILGAWWVFFGTFSQSYADVLNFLVGILAFGAGIFFLYEGIFTDGTCKVTNSEQRKTISKKISDIAHSPVSWITFFGILLLALSVNIIEFACSAGYPQVFTNILNSLSGDIVHKLGLLFTYLFAYMLDDIIIFGIALISIEKLGITQKYVRGTNVLGGGIMLCIGLWMAWSNMNILV